MVSAHTTRCGWCTARSHGPGRARSPVLSSSSMISAHCASVALSHSLKGRLLHQESCQECHPRWHPSEGAASRCRGMNQNSAGDASQDPGTSTVAASLSFGRHRSLFPLELLTHFSLTFSLTSPCVFLSNSQPAHCFTPGRIKTLPGLISWP